jgi:SAM-dependent methyltransferase
MTGTNREQRAHPSRERRADPSRATGIGEPAVTAARRVGPTGQVVAVDQSPQMLAIARERAAALGLRDMHVLELDAEQLHLLEGPFDAALCRWGTLQQADHCPLGEENADGDTAGWPCAVAPAPRPSPGSSA